ncbi:interferon related developmental regulator 2 [Phyllostomus discolor]|uniref:Interferon related developmental regulator 2 n=1 Tax=Phyllostomus discolor TaxID=89673 RepID=A0A833ZTB2_9CHIR|nr:interferon related developmental regulator 2 [Phyllostomus discolor]
MDALCGVLRTLATDSNKYRAKADRRRQRCTFRAVLHSVEGSECEEETVRFGLEVLYVDSWARRRVYAAFKDVLGSGMHHHLQVGRPAGPGGPAQAPPTSLGSPSPLSPQNNELLRDIFDLGPVLVLDAAALKACKLSRFEKVGTLGRPGSPPLCHPGRPSPPPGSPLSAPVPAPVQRRGLQSADQGAEPSAGQARGRPVRPGPPKRSPPPPLPPPVFLTGDSALVPARDCRFIFVMTKPKTDLGGRGWRPDHAASRPSAPALGHCGLPPPAPSQCGGQQEGRGLLSQASLPRDEPLPWGGGVTSGQMSQQVGRGGYLEWISVLIFKEY